MSRHAKQNSTKQIRLNWIHYRIGEVRGQLLVAYSERLLKHVFKGI